MLSQEELLAAIPSSLDGVHIPELGPKTAGKVRDIYRLDGRRVLITTDRISAFDRVLGLIPYKGQVLNQLSAWWFEQTGDIVGNHLLSVPDPNVTIAREAEALPVEVIVRGYITGVTKTSLWTLYAAGVERPYGLDLPEGLQLNDALPTPVITPTTKAEAGAHDERLTRDEILERGLVAPELWAEVENAALTMFRRGQEIARAAGLLLVDTKYEFGLIDGKLTLIDEIHTPDSSRYWTIDSYGKGGEPDNYDKEVLRKWYVARGYKGDGEAPPMTDELIVSVASLYITLFERLTGQQFVPGEQPAAERIAAALASYAGRS